MSRRKIGFVERILKGSLLPEENEEDSGHLGAIDQNLFPSYEGTCKFSWFCGHLYYKVIL